ncbi:MAG: thiamine pyrophosphate-dependent enzyme, partial [Candidatus Thiodiazotropha sp. 6PLUC10]
EFGLGMRIAIDKQNEHARELLLTLRNQIGEALTDALLNADQHSEAAIFEQRQRIETLKQKCHQIHTPEAETLISLSDTLARKSVWLVGGDGWAYDIGYGGVDHVLASGRNVNILLLDTETYSNTGGQTSKATPLGAVAKFSAGGKATSKKDIALMAMSYSNVYVAQVAFGAKDVQTLRTFLEAESYDGPSLIICYSPCIAQGIDLSNNIRQQELAVDSGHWPLFRYDPRRSDKGENPLKMDSKQPSISYRDFANSEARFSVLQRTQPEASEKFMRQAQSQIKTRYQLYEQLAHLAMEQKEE